MKLAEVPTIQVTHLTESEIRSYRLADNKLADNSNWDTALLKIELEYLVDTELDFDMETIGFETTEIDLLFELNPNLEAETPLSPPPFTRTQRFKIRRYLAMRSSSYWLWRCP